MSGVSFGKQTVRERDGLEAGQENETQIGRRQIQLLDPVIRIHFALLIIRFGSISVTSRWSSARLSRWFRFLWLLWRLVEALGGPSR